MTKLKVAAKPKVATKPKPVAKPKAKPTEVDRTIPTAISSQKYKVGPAVYNPRAAHNVDSWTRMCKHLEKGVTTGAVLAAELTTNGKHPAKTHFDFIGYLERRGAIAIAK